MTRQRGFLFGAWLLLALTTIVGPTPVRDAETWRGASDASLAFPWAYTVLSPFCSILDALTLLSLRQHAALLITIGVCVIVWRVVRARRRGTSFARELGIALASLGAVLVVYAVGALVPRPMAALRVNDRGDVLVDFHSHTNHSWDGRKWFTTARNRAWHTAAGFNAAYVSDHKSTAGALEGMAANAPRWIDARETLLLPSLESRDHYQHVNMYGLDPHAPVDAKGEWHDPPPPADGAPAPFLMLTIPGNIRTLPDNEVHGVARVLAIELSDAAPKGLNMMQRESDAILHLADSLDLAVVAGSDNHGWGSTAAGWTVMNIPGWKVMSATRLDSAIQAKIRTERRHAARVYVRDTPNPGSSTLALVFTVPAVIWRVLVDLDPFQRLSWLGWIAVIAWIASVPSSRAARVNTPPAPRTKSENA
ncbi:MAG TPA: hypothetical protein VGT98_11090 [Candidatus Elarobacter sp.]|nr:hypothetical protein [Candidatus Elarobacter sp.]